MKYNSIGEQLIAKAQELDPNYKPDKFNDMSEALNIILNNTGGSKITKRTLTIPKSELSLGGDLTAAGEHPAYVLSETARANFVSFINGTSVEECAFVKIIIKTNAELSEGVCLNLALNLNKSMTDYEMSYIGSNIDIVSLYANSYYMFVNDTFDKNVAFFQNSESYFDGVYPLMTELEIIEYIF